jgi:hypothetical protein
VLEGKKAQHQLCLRCILKRGGQLALNYNGRKLRRYYKKVTFVLLKKFTGEQKGGKNDEDSDLVKD